MSQYDIVEIHLLGLTLSAHPFHFSKSLEENMLHTNEVFLSNTQDICDSRKVGFQRYWHLAHGIIHVVLLSRLDGDIYYIIAHPDFFPLAVV